MARMSRAPLFSSLLVVVAIARLAGAQALPSAKASSLPAPRTRVDEARDTYGAVTVTDKYRWLEDQNAPETRAWIDSQNRYSESVLEALPGREALRRRLGELLKVDTVRTPYEQGGRYFFFKRRAAEDLAILYVRRGERGKDEALVDPHPLSPDHRTSVNLLDIARDGGLIAWGAQLGGEDENTVRFREVDTGRDLSDVLPRARYLGIELTPDRKGVYFSRLEKEGPRAYWHAFGSEPAADRKIFGDGYGPEKGLGLDLSDDGRTLLLVVSHGSAAVKTEIYMQTPAGSGPVVPIVNDVDARFVPRFAGDRLFLETNWKAPNGRILAVDLKAPERDRWKEIVPARDSAIDGFSAAGGRLFVTYLENVLSKVRIFDAEGKPRGEVAFPEIGNLSGMRGRWASPEAFFSFQSFVTPQTIYRYDVAKGTRGVWAKQSVPIASGDFEVRQVRYPSGTARPFRCFWSTGRG